MLSLPGVPWIRLQQFRYANWHRGCALDADLISTAAAVHRQNFLKRVEDDELPPSGSQLTSVDADGVVFGSAYHRERISTCRAAVGHRDRSGHVAQNHRDAVRPVAAIDQNARARCGIDDDLIVAVFAQDLGFFARSTNEIVSRTAEDDLSEIPALCSAVVNGFERNRTGHRD